MIYRYECFFTPFCCARINKGFVIYYKGHGVRSLKYPKEEEERKWWDVHGGQDWVEVWGRLRGPRHSGRHRLTRTKARHCPPVPTLNTRVLYRIFTFFKSGLWIRICMDPHSFFLLGPDPGTGSNCKKFNLSKFGPASWFFTSEQSFLSFSMVENSSSGT